MEITDFQNFLSWATPLFVAILGAVVGYIFAEMRDIRRQHASDVLRLAQDSVSRREFEQLEKRIADQYEHVKDGLAEIKSGITRVHERIDELKE